MLPKYRKAVVSAAITLIATLLAAFGVTAGPENIFGMGQEALAVLVVGILTTVGVWAAPNEPT